MKDIYNILSQRLSDKGLIPIEVSRLVKDAVNIIGDGGESTVGLLNEKLESLGWGRRIMDQLTFEQTLLFVENKKDYKIAKTTLH
jgi:hypothetical protein